MSNLLKELGQGYFTERFKGSMFKGPDDSTCVIEEVEDSEQVLAKKLAGSVAKPVIESVLIPADFFVDMSVFATPELGWRSCAQGKYLAYFYRNNRSYHRGTAASNVDRNISEFSYWIASNDSLSLSYYGNDNITSKLIMEPEYISLTEGVAKIADGKLLSFCISASMAVHAEEDEVMALMFGPSKVGTININGEINCNIPAIRTVLEEQQ